MVVPAPRTVEAVLDFIRERRCGALLPHHLDPGRDVLPDLVRHLVPDREIVSRSLTFKMFSDYGMPVTFYNDQYDLLLSQDYLFARKISPEARVLEAGWGRSVDIAPAPISPSATRAAALYLPDRAGPDRAALRHAVLGTRSTLGPDRELS
jgi:hypothetical protein